MRILSRERRLGHHTSKGTLLYMVRTGGDSQEYAWGVGGRDLKGVPLTKFSRGREHILLIGPPDEKVVLREGWIFELVQADPQAFDFVIHVFDASEDISPEKGFPIGKTHLAEHYWVVYQSPWTGNAERIAGPWG